MSNHKELVRLSSVLFHLAEQARSASSLCSSNACFMTISPDRLQVLRDVLAGAEQRVLDFCDAVNQFEKVAGVTVIERREQAQVKTTKPRRSRRSGRAA